MPKKLTNKKYPVGESLLSKHKLHFEDHPKAEPQITFKNIINQLVRRIKRLKK